jgi:hypothetical protein
VPSRGGGPARVWKDLTPMVYDVTSAPLEGPTPAELAAIEAEWPLIEAEIAVLDAQIRILTVVRPGELDWRRLRRAQARALRAARTLAAQTPPPDLAA